MATSKQFNAEQGVSVGQGVAVIDSSGNLTTQTITGRGTNADVQITPNGTGSVIVPSINKVVLTQPATSATLTIANGKTLTVNETFTMTADAGAIVDFGTGGTIVFEGGGFIYDNVTTLSSLSSIGTITTGVWNSTNIGIGYGGTGASLASPGAGPNNDRIFFWDSSANANVGGTAFLQLGNSLVITGTSFDTVQDLRTSATPSFAGLTVNGNLTVTGTSVILNTTQLSVDDINITLGDTVSPTDTTANGGGITLKGTTDKTINWDQANASWTSSEHINLPAGKQYRINNAQIAASNLSNGTTGAGAVVLASVPTLTAPVLGNATATTLSFSGAVSATPIGITSTITQDAAGVIGILNSPALTGGASTTAMYGISNQASYSPAVASIANVYHTLSLATLSNGASYTNISSEYARMDLGAGAVGGTVTNYYGINVAPPTINAAATKNISNYYGVIITNPINGALQTISTVYGISSQVAGGTNRWNLHISGSADNYLAGRVGIGIVPASTSTLHVQTTSTGATTKYGIINTHTIANDVTAIFYNNISTIATNGGGAGIGSVLHYDAAQGTFSGTVSSQFGYRAQSTLTGAANNYGFYGDIAAASGRWNFYAGGSAANYFSGVTGIGAVSDGFNKLYAYNTGPNTSTTEYASRHWMDATAPSGGVSKFAIRADGVVGTGWAATGIVGGMSVRVINDKAINVAGSLQGIRVDISNTNTGTLPAAYGYVATPMTNSGGAVVNGYYGYVAEATIAATENHGFFVGNGAAVTAGKTSYAYRSQQNIATGGGTTWGLYFDGTAASYHAGSIGFGASAGADTKLRVAGTYPSSGTNSTGIRADGTIPNTSTNIVVLVDALAVTQSATFNVTHLIGHRARQTAFSGGSTVTNQFGFLAENTLTGATNNYGFRSEIGAASGRWNFHASGTANNYLAGNLYIGSETPWTAGVKLYIDTTISSTSGSDYGSVINTNVSSASGTGVKFGQYSQVNTTTGYGNTAAVCSYGATFNHTLAATIADARCFQAYGQVNTGIAGTISNLYLYTAQPAAKQSGAVTAVYGYHFSNQVDPLNSYAFYTANTAGVNKWAFYDAGGANSAFAGNVRIGSTTAPTVALDVTGSITSSATVTAVTLTGAISSTSTGTTQSFGDNSTKIATTAYADRMRTVPASANTTIATSDVGKCLEVSGTVTVPNSTMAAGDVVSIYNTTASAITITASITTLRMAGTANTGNRTLAGYGMATIRFVSGTLGVISGAGVS